MSAASIVDLENVRFGRGETFRLKIDRFSLQRGERVLVTGPSGCGKSTLLGLLCGALPAEAGAVRVLDHDLAQMSGADRDRFRAEHFGVIFQMFNLLPWLSIIDNVLLPLSFAPDRRARASSGGTPRVEAMRLLERLGLGARTGSARVVAELSAGQQQRVAAARALIGSPAIILADEPTSALDLDNARTFHDLLSGEVRRAGATLVLVSHDERFAATFDRRMALADILAPEADVST